MLENLHISDIAVHEIFVRGEDRRKVGPKYAEHLENLSSQARNAFQERVTDALSAKAKAVEMDIVRTDAGCFLDLARGLVSVSSAEFLEMSGIVADRLAQAQTAISIPGGMVIVFRGETGPGGWPYLAVMKAEVQDGFRRRQDGERSFTEFVNDLFLTKATRLYKIGFFYSVSSDTKQVANWRSIVFDHHIVAANREAAALYFYESFLGCGFKEDSAYETARFFNLTKEFVAGAVSDRDARHGIQDALFVYVKNDQAPTLTTNEFAERHMPLPLRDKYRNHMKAKQFPERAIKRDTSTLSGRLKRRRFKYGTDIEFSASPEALNDGRARIETVSSDGGGQQQTIITITEPFLKEL